MDNFRKSFRASFRSSRKWKPECMKHIRMKDGELPLDRRTRGDPAGEGGDTGPPARHRSYTEECRGVTFVELTKKDSMGLGLVISGGIDKDKRAQISQLRPGGVAQRSDELEVGDFILSVNGIRTHMLKHDEIVSLLLNASDSVILEIEYELPEPPQNTFSVLCKRIEVVLERDGDSYGFTLRGGMHEDPERCRPLTVTQIRQASAADREGTMKIGDRILAMNGMNVTQCTLAEALSVLRHADDRVRLLIEYDVSVMDAVQNACGPLLVEIDKTPGSALGISLNTCAYKGKTVICIDNIKPASIADRCGALHQGDHVLSIDDTSLERLSVQEASQLLRAAAAEHIKLEILPVTQLRGQGRHAAISSVSRAGQLPALLPPPPRSLRNHTPQHPANSSYSSLQSHATYNSMVTQMGSAYNSPCHTPMGTMSSRGSSRTGWASKHRKYSTNPLNLNIMTLLGPASSLASSTTFSNQLMFPAHQLCHVEVNEMVLQASHRGFGLTLHGGTYSSEVLLDPPFIAHIESKSSAEKCGVLQEGDRVLAINGQLLENKTLEEANNMLHDSSKVTLLVEFDVAESVIPSTGVFNVKLAKRGSGLGITITAPRDRKSGDPLIISDVKKGSVAHRTGTIHPGDRLLAIDQYRLENCSIEDAAQVLHDATNIVKLKIQKDETFSEDVDPVNCITYTVELRRHGGPLGVTISGTEEPFDPIFISGLTPGGLAEKTGALHISDRILAINNKSLRKRPLSEAISLLQNAGDSVTLRISRPLNNDQNGQRNSVTGKSHDSVDSALESWDSSGLDSNNAPPQPPHKTNGAPDGSGSSHTSHEDPDHPTYSTASSTTTTTTAISAPVTSATMASSQPNNSNLLLKCRLPQQQSGLPASYNDISGEIRINGTKWRPMSNNDVADSRSGSATPDIPLSPASSQDADEWSKQIDELDHLGTLQLGSNQDRFSPYSDLGLPPPPPNCVSPTGLSEKSGLAVNGNLSDFDDDRSVRSARNSVSSARQRMARGAELHLKEVEHEMQHIFTPTPVELLRVTLSRWHRGEDFGLCLSDGVYEKGVYISAVRPGGPADRVGMRPFDKILQVHNVNTKDLECKDVIPIIQKSGQAVDMVISRNPLAEIDELDNVSDVWDGGQGGLVEETV